MQVVNELGSSPEARDAFFESLDPHAPLVMVNLLKFKDKAEYADGRDSDLTGAQAYALYSEVVSQMIVDLGGTLVHGGMVTNLLVGQVEELWDVVGLVEYPNPGAFREMIESDAYQVAHVHREAGLAGQLNLSTTSPGYASQRAAD